MHDLESPFVTNQLALRRTLLNEQPERPAGAYVLYWMQATHRLEENWALRQAVLTADRAARPLLIYQGLDPTYEHANDRIHAFILENAREMAARAKALGLTYIFSLRRRRNDDRRVVDRIAARAVTVVTDAFPTAGIAERTRRFAERTDVRVLAVDGHGVIPVAAFEKEEWAARTIRPKILKIRDHALEPVRDRAPKKAMPASVLKALECDPLDLARLDLDATLASCEIDHAVPRVTTIASGRAAGLARLAAFVHDALPDYEERRGEPTDTDGSSRLSPYLHFGQVSAAEVARAALATGHAAATEKFLDELLTWRELSLNFCVRNPRFGTLHALPPWIHDTMRKHVKDPREALYTRDQLERAETHEPLWNAAQRELVGTGAIHNVMRMYWGKSVLTWTTTYSEALAHLIHLNNKWALDGRDPSSYGGIQWCFGKFDRPWGERPVWGTIRSMSLQRAYQKFDARGYEHRWNGDPQPSLGV
ncbi:MAG: deoxyribodipyrimidine photo-lyase [Gemmatimonadetes bacterium]|nr:deoxyribodipyrimidine photo-lyase [Gemmatimonadota bacterium]